MQSVRVLVINNLKNWRNLSRCAVLNQTAVETPRAEAITIPQPSNVDKIASPKIEKLITEITHLNLIEVSELSELLKKRLNLPDAPVMAMGGFASPAAAEDEEVVPVKVKTSFTVKLTKFDDKQKVPLIKEIKALLEGMNLVQAKKFVESAPTIVKADISKEEAEKLKEALSKVGAVIEIE